MSCINVFQGQIKPFIYIWNCLNSEVVFFPVFPTLGVQNLFFPGRYLPVNTMVKTGYCPKPSNPEINIGLDNGLVPSGTKPLSKLMITMFTSTCTIITCIYRWQWHIAVTPLLMHWSYSSLEISHWCTSITCIYHWLQDCSNSIANALDLLQSCTKPLIIRYIQQAGRDNLAHSGLMTGVWYNIWYEWPHWRVSLHPCNMAHP